MHRLFLPFALLVCFLVPNAAIASQADVSASKGWIATPAAGSTTAVAGVEIQNPTMYEVYVVSASSEAAAAVELREGSGADSKAVKEVPIAAFGSLELKPGGPHLLLKDLKKPLEPGQTVELVLLTDGGVTLKVNALVR